MQMPDADPSRIADAAAGNWVDRYAPRWLKPFARLARWDRPIGFWLLFWPCAFALALAVVANPLAGFDWRTLLLMLAGAVLMRGAGCTFNDIVDRNIDDKVARTRLRPIPSGQVSTQAAIAFMVLQALLGLVILIQFNAFTIELGVASLVLVAIYPFMKRITWWPQLFLGLAFSWGALLGWTSQTGTLGVAPVLLYAGCIAWVIGYDTVYALQDIEDDALVGVKSTARLFGRHARLMIGLFYVLALALWFIAGLWVGGGVLFIIGLLCVAALLAWQVATVDKDAPNNTLVRFHANNWVGLGLTLSLLAAWQW